MQESFQTISRTKFPLSNWLPLLTNGWRKGAFFLSPNTAWLRPSSIPKRDTQTVFNCDDVLSVLLHCAKLSTFRIVSLHVTVFTWFPVSTLSRHQKKITWRSHRTNDRNRSLSLNAQFSWKLSRVHRNRTKYICKGGCKMLETLHQIHI